MGEELPTQQLPKENAPWGTHEYTVREKMIMKSILQLVAVTMAIASLSVEAKLAGKKIEEKIDTGR